VAAEVAIEARTRLLSIGGRLMVDGWTAEAVAALRSDGVPAILLKGPAVARWLYPDEPWARTYTDVDLLVTPAHVDRAASVLRDIGYGGGTPRRHALAVDHATTLRRETDGALVDLHWKLHGMEALPAVAPVWEAMSTDAEDLVVAGVPVAIPGVVARTLHVALHLEPEDPPGSAPWEDLRRAVESVDRPTWARAAAMARLLDVDGEMGARLRLQPAGAVLADELRLWRPPSRWFAVRAAMAEQHAPSASRRVGVLVAPGSLREKRRRATQALFPPGADLGSVARVVGTIPMSVLAWRRFRRAR
jgi:hypothetical protein